MAIQIVGVTNGNFFELLNADTALGISDYPVTIGGWYRSDESPGGGRHYGGFGSAGSPFQSIGLQRIASGGDRWAGRHEGASGAALSDSSDRTPALTIENGTWRHIVVVATSSTSVELFIDAVTCTANTTDVGTPTWHDTFYLGSDAQLNGGAQEPNCTYAEIAIFGAALSPTAISNWFNGGTGRAANDPLVGSPAAYWTLDEAVSSTMSDSIGSNDLSANGGTTGMAQVTHPVGPFGGGSSIPAIANHYRRRRSCC